MPTQYNTKYLDYKMNDTIVNGKLRKNSKRVKRDLTLKTPKPKVENIGELKTECYGINKVILDKIEANRKTLNIENV